MQCKTNIKVATLHSTVYWFGYSIVMQKPRRRRVHVCLPAVQCMLGFSPPACHHEEGWREKILNCIVQCFSTYAFLWMEGLTGEKNEWTQWWNHRPFIFRHGYDYPPHSHWDYRDNYGYYDHGYYRGQHGRQGTVIRNTSVRQQGFYYHYTLYTDTCMLLWSLRCWPVGSPRLLENGPLPWQNIQAGTFRELLHRGPQVSREIPPLWKSTPLLIYNWE